jgi:hypothetical protein
MRQVALALFFVLSCAAVSGQKIEKKRLTDATASANSYNLTLHVTHSEITVAGSQTYLRLWGVIEVRGFELIDNAAGTGNYFAGTLLHPGDYKARLFGAETKAGQKFARTYELLFSDGTNENFTVVGESE